MILINFFNFIDIIGELKESTYIMSEQDFRNTLSNHILIFGCFNSFI